MARRLRTLVLLAALTLTAPALAGCSWGSQEPGLFRTPLPSTSSQPSDPVDDRLPEPTDPALPVAGEALWTTGDGSDVRVRFAVHAVRRTENATVLDWSVTPLTQAGRAPGQPLPAGADLGLGRSLAGEQNIVLLDPGSRRAYRPLANISPEQFSRCLCTPLFAVTPSLRFGDTRLLQLSFPILPAALQSVDVQLSNVAVIARVPLTAAGAAPLTRTGTDLTRPAGAVAPATAAQIYPRGGRPGRAQTVRVDRVVAVPGLTSVEWTLHSVNDQSGFSVSQDGAPTAAALPDDVRVVNRSPASGPRLRVPGSTRSLGVGWTTAPFSGLPTYECLCSEIDLWAKGLQLAGGSVHLDTTLPGLPADAVRVDVTFPGLPTFPDVPVTRPQPRLATTGDAVAVDPGTWTYDQTSPPRGWATRDWPTPLPAAAQVGDYQSRTERLLDRLP